MDNFLSCLSDIFIGNGFIIILACLLVGAVIKGTASKIPNKFIPFINIVISIVLGFVIPGTYDDRDIVSKIIILIFIGLSSTGFYEILCVMVKRRFSIDLTKLVKKCLGDNSDESIETEQSSSDSTTEDCAETESDEPVQEDPGA